MLPSFLITVREVIEASLIVATILGILIKLDRQKEVKTVWHATAVAALVSVTLLVLCSLIGVKVQDLYTGKVEEIIEGVLMVTSALFITWAVFFLHNYFGRYKTKLIHKIKQNVENKEQKGLFILVFTAVAREGFEIVLFLSTVYFSSEPQHIFAGFGLGAVVGILISFAFFAATLRMPVFYAFRFTSAMLILFASGLLARAVHEFMEAGIIPKIGSITFQLLPTKATFAADMIKAIFGVTKEMDALQLAFYIVYCVFMTWWVFIHHAKNHVTHN